MTDKDFADKLVSERRRLGLRQVDAAKLCEVSQRTMALWETKVASAKPVTQEGVLARLKKAKVKK